MPKKQLMTLSLETDTYQWVKDAAAAHKQTVSEFVGDAVEKYRKDIQGKATKGYALMITDDDYGCVGDSILGDFIKEGNEKGWEDK